MITKLLSLINMILAVSVLIPTAIITRLYIVRPRQVVGIGDWFAVLLPLVPPLVALFSCISLWKIKKRTPVGKGIVWGMFLSCAAYMLIQVETLSENFTLISQDGTAHWGLLELPVYWIAIPLLLIAVGIGGLAGWIIERILSKKVSNPA